MKKLKLKALELGAKEVLTRAQLKMFWVVVAVVQKAIPVHGFGQFYT